MSSTRVAPKHPTMQNGAAIRAIRQLLGLTVDQVASELESTPSAVRNYENEHRSMSPEILVRLAGILRVDVRALVRSDLTFGATEQSVQSAALPPQWTAAS